MPADSNHPRALLPFWRADVDRIHENCAANTGKVEEIVLKTMLARANAIRECADQLEARLRWSGMLDV